MTTDTPNIAPHPWTLEKDFGQHCIIANDGTLVADLSNCKEAHRNLLCSAPELLEALDALSLVVGLIPIAGHNDALQSPMEIARAAIAKAKGESK